MLDPLTQTLMRDPVTLPASSQVPSPRDPGTGNLSRPDRGHGLQVNAPKIFEVIQSSPGSVLDPLTQTLMRDPVTLPASAQV